jgi:hypothetical protein
MQTSNTVLMISPGGFMHNNETEGTNVFQQVLAMDDAEIRKAALAEFNSMVYLLQENDIEVLTFDDPSIPPNLDTVFPNNWFSTHPDGTILIYPMCAANRRAEKRTDITDSLHRSYSVSRIVDLSYYESAHKFLEGTGSMVFDHVHKTVYACMSARTYREPLIHAAGILGYQVVCFRAHDKNGKEIYHTNVMLSIGTHFSLLCTESITDMSEQEFILRQLNLAGKEVIPISFSQMHSFACNALEVRNKKGESITILSQSAYDSLKKDQKVKLAAYTRLLPVLLPVIEATGGGSARCMLAEIFLPSKQDV